MVRRENRSIKVHRSMKWKALNKKNRWRLTQDDRLAVVRAAKESENKLFWWHLRGFATFPADCPPPLGKKHGVTHLSASFGRGEFASLRRFLRPAVTPHHAAASHSIPRLKSSSQPVWETVPESCWQEQRNLCWLTKRQLHLIRRKQFNSFSEQLQSTG